MIASVSASPMIALMIGRKVATSVPNVNVRITIAAAIPITSLISVAGTDSFEPSCPPVAVSRPAAFAGFVAASTMS